MVNSWFIAGKPHGHKLWSKVYPFPYTASIMGKTKRLLRCDICDLAQRKKEEGSEVGSSSLLT